MPFTSTKDPTSNSQISNGNTYSLSYGYDLALEQTSYAFPSTRIQSTAYDTGGRVVSANGSYNGSSTTYGSTYGYFSDGTLANVTLGPSGQVQQYCQNNRLQIVGVRLGPAGGVNLTGGGLTNNCGSSSDVLNLTMTYGSAGANNGNLTGEGFAAPLSTSETFSYDAYNRIGLAYEGPNQGSNCTSWSQTYNYDAYGNRWVTAPCGFTLYQFTPESDAYTSNNQLPNTFNGAGYDNNGNQTAMGLFSFTYDAENRQYTSSIGGTVTQYTYDGEGRRVMKTTGDTQTVYVYDADGQVASEYSNVTPPYVGTLYLTGDHLGSTRAETNSAGAAQWYHDYLPFGEELLSGIGGRGSLYGPGDVDGTTHKFTSKERDAETGGSAAQGLDYFGFRYYSGAQGRWTSPDQPFADQHIEDPQSWNMYAYVRNNPLVHVDPNGKACSALNNSSGFCQRADLYTNLDTLVGSKTRFFAAASAASQELADVAVPGFGAMAASPGTRAFLESTGQASEKVNLESAGQILSGQMTGSEEALDRSMVHREQTAVQKQLDQLKGANAEGYGTAIKEINTLLNDMGAKTQGLVLGGNLLFSTDKAYSTFLGGVRKNLGHNIDFANQKDREAIGNALVQHIRMVDVMSRATRYHATDLKAVDSVAPRSSSQYAFIRRPVWRFVVP